MIEDTRKTEIARLLAEAPSSLRRVALLAVEEAFGSDLDDPLGLDPYDLRSLIASGHSFALGLEDEETFQSEATKACVVAGARNGRRSGSLKSNAAYSVATAMGPRPENTFLVIRAEFSKNYAPGSEEWARVEAELTALVDDAMLDLL